MKIKVFAVIALCIVCAGCGVGASPRNFRARSRGQKTAKHVFLIVEENHSFDSVYPGTMPWLSALGDKYGIATNYFSNETGSLLDYLWLSSGSGEQSFGCDGNGCKKVITNDNIFRQLNQAGLTWNVYADSLPKAGFNGPVAGNYVKRHNPALWYSDVANHASEQQKVVPFGQLAKDIAAGDLPDYAIIVPDLIHDAHNASPRAADQWLKKNIGPLINSSYFQPGGDSVMFITFDNGDNDDQGQVFTAVIGQRVISGVKVNTAFRHENTLRTIMELLGLKTFPGASANAAPMNEFFQ
jgi:phosphatidylinositol-3-phosphatase